MQYIVLMSTFLTLVFGFLFYANQFPSEGWKVFAIILCLGIIILSNVLTVSMTLWDVYTRFKNIKKRRKQKKKTEALEKALDDKRQLMFDELHGMRMISQKTNIPFKTEFNFKLEWNEADESSEDELNSMNDILSNLFSLRRVKRKVYLVNRKRQKIVHKIVRNGRDNTLADSTMTLDTTISLANIPFYE
jgi:hypothetical protein